MSRWNGHMFSYKKTLLIQPLAIFWNPNQNNPAKSWKANAPVTWEPCTPTTHTHPYSGLTRGVRGSFQLRYTPCWFPGRWKISWKSRSSHPLVGEYAGQSLLFSIWYHWLTNRFYSSLWNVHLDRTDIHFWFHNYFNWRWARMNWINSFIVRSHCMQLSKWISWISRNNFNSAIICVINTSVVVVCCFIVNLSRSIN